MKRTNKIITAILGISMFMFGVLKFVDPFKSWYNSQIYLSDIPLADISYWAGQFGEIIAGCVFLLIIFPGSLNKSLTDKLFVLGNSLVIIMMLTASYVHFQPEVPAEVLPLKIKMPLIPGFFMIMAIINLYLHVKIFRTTEPADK